MIRIWEFAGSVTAACGYSSWLLVGAGVRVCRDRIYKTGRVTLRHRTRLHHIGVGRRHKGTRVILLIDGLDVRIVSEQGELLRHLTLDPARDYLPQG